MEEIEEQSVSILPEKKKSDRFPGFTYQTIICRICKQPIGYLYSPVDRNVANMIETRKTPRWLKLTHSIHLPDIDWKLPRLLPLYKVLGYSLPDYHNAERTRNSGLHHSTSNDLPQQRVHGNSLVFHMIARLQGRWFILRHCLILTWWEFGLTMQPLSLDTIIRILLPHRSILSTCPVQMFPCMLM